MNKTLKYITFTIAISFAFVSNVTLASEKVVSHIPSPKDLMIVSSYNINQNAEATVENGIKHHAKMYILSIYNTTDKPLSFSTKNGCFKAEDESGNVSVTQKIVDPELLKNLLPKSEQRGYVIFSTKDDSILKTKYVTWSTECSYNK